MQGCLTLKYHRVGKPATVRQLHADRVTGFDKGRWPVRLSANRAGFSPAPVSPIWAIARVPLSNPDTSQKLTRLIAAPRYFAFRASRPALARPERRASESDGLGAESAARAAWRAALKPYRKFSHGCCPDTVVQPLSSSRGKAGQNRVRLHLMLDTSDTGPT
jgi:hypothetical protein